MLQRIPAPLAPVLALLLIPYAHAQATTQTVHGTVLNSATHQPVARALVTSDSRRLATMTDEQGRFTFELHLTPKPAAPAQGPDKAEGNSDALTLTAQRPGYLPAEPVPFTLTGTSSDLTLQLRPAATITGRVSVPAPEIPYKIALRLLRHQSDNRGNLTWAAADAAITDSHGLFRFSALTPGDYTVVSTSWRPDDDDLLPARSEPAIQYPPTYAGGAEAITSALKLHLRPGETAIADLSLHPVTCYPVTIPIQGRVPSDRTDMRAIAADGTPWDSSALPFTPDARAGAITGWLPDGDYKLKLFLFSTDDEGTNFAEAPLHVAGAPVRSPALTPRRTFTIPLRVHLQFSHPDPAPKEDRRLPPPRRRDSVPVVSLEEQPIGVALLNGSARGGTGSVTAAMPGQTALANVAPGTFSAESYVRRGYIATLTSGGVDLLHQSLTISPDSTPAPIEATLRDDFTSVEGSLNSTAEPSSSVTFAYFLPLDASAHFNQTNFNSEGAFSLSNLVPGSYLVVCFRGRVFPLAWNDPATLDAYRSKGITITALPNQTLNLKLTALNPPEDAYSGFNGYIDTVR